MKHVLNGQNCLCFRPRFWQSKYLHNLEIPSNKTNIMKGFPQSYMSGLLRCFQSRGHGLQQDFATLGLAQSCQWLDMF
jgi:hypothetical protein